MVIHKKAAKYINKSFFFQKKYLKRSTFEQADTTPIKKYFYVIVSHNIIYNPNKIKKDIIREKRPIASDNANPKMAYEKSCGFSDGLRA